MINNRQSGRRRGRGGQRSQQGQGRGAEQGNRIDNRARGNASQLHEKYKTLARDAQTQGDRVMAEYYLQFADHYFRVLSESRARFEENRRQRDDIHDDEDEAEEVRAEDVIEGEEQDRGEPEARQPRRNRDRDRERQPRRETRDEIAEPVAETKAEPEPREERRARSPRQRRDSRAETNGHELEAATELGLDVDRLPPALSVSAEEGAPAPKPRARRPRKTAGVEAPVEG